MNSIAKLTPERLEQLAVEIREFLLEHDMWQDVNIYFNGKCFSCFDPWTRRYYYNDRSHLIVVEGDSPKSHFEYVNPDHILSMSFEGPVCHMLYYGTDPRTKKAFDRIFRKYGLYYEFGDHWNFTCYYIGG